MAKSGYLKDTVAPGLKEAFSQSGGLKGLGRRVLGGAAVGGATTGTISALRGGDFWEGAKGGALAGGAAGAGRHAWQMGQTGTGSMLMQDMGAEKTRMTPGATQFGGVKSFSNAYPNSKPSRAVSASNSPAKAKSKSAVKTAGSAKEIKQATQKPSNVSKQVHTQTRLNNTNKAAKSVVEQLSLFN